MMTFKSILAHGLISGAFCLTGNISLAIAHETTENCECPVEAMSEQSERESVKHIVEIQKFKFSAPVLDVQVGDEVTWINMDIVPHTATALDKSWDSGRLKKGESFTLTITDATSLDYFCLYHRQMKASLNFAEAE